jgi:hypothetical protein
MRGLTLGLLLLFGVSSFGDGPVHAASCKPLKQGTCNACKNCRYCGHCARGGGSCSVCAKA